MKSKIPLRVAKPIAEEIAAALQPTTKRLVIAGSIRRAKPEVGDIEIVLEPTVGTYDLLDKWIRDGKVMHRDGGKCWGPKARSFRWPLPPHFIDVSYIQCDVFLQPDPATWGVNMFLRTGSAEFNMLMFRKRKHSGWMPDYLDMRSARIWAGSTALETPDEDSIFALWGMEPVVPAQRTGHYEPRFGELPAVEIGHAPEQTSLF